MIVLPSQQCAWVEMLPFRAFASRAWGALELRPDRRARIWVRVCFVGEIRTLEYELAEPTAERVAPEGEGWLLGRVFDAHAGSGLFAGAAGLQVEALKAVEAHYYGTRGHR